MKNKIFKQFFNIGLRNLSRQKRNTESSTEKIHQFNIHSQVSRTNSANPKSRHNVMEKSMGKCATNLQNKL